MARRHTAGETVQPGAGALLGLDAGGPASAIRRRTIRLGAACRSTPSLLLSQRRLRAPFKQKKAAYKAALQD